MLLVINNQIIPPRQWMHNYYIMDNYKQTLKDYLEQYYLPVPYHWGDNNMNIFDEACYGIIPELGNNKPDERN